MTIGFLKIYPSGLTGGGAWRWWHQWRREIYAVETTGGAVNAD